MPAPLTGGRLMAAISTSIVAILSKHCGRGPMSAKTYAIDDIIVVAMRHDFQMLVADRYKQVIEERTGRNVVAFLSQTHLDPDITIEIFFMDATAPASEAPGADETQPVIAPRPRATERLDSYRQSKPTGRLLAHRP